MTRRTTIDVSDERTILQWIIASNDLFRHVLPTYDAPALFETAFCRTVAKWVYAWGRVETDKAPSAALSMLYQMHLAEIPDEKESQAIGDFLQKLSADWSKAEPPSVNFAKERCDIYFRRRVIQRSIDMATRALEAGTDDGIRQAENAFLGFSKPLGGIEVVDLLHDTDKVHDAYTAPDETVFRMPGAIGELLGPIVRGDFVGILSREKMGKSFWVDLFAISAMYQGRKVLILDFELVQKQKMRRLYGHLQGRPKSDLETDVPYFSPTGEIVYQRRIVPAVDPGKNAIADFQKGIIRLSGGGSVKFANIGGSKCSMRDLETLIKNLKRIHDWVPDVIIPDSLDYAQSSAREKIDKLDEIWGDARAWAQDGMFDCAVVSPSHTGRQSKRENGDENDVSGDIGKMRKVTKTLVLNRTPMEAKYGITRVSSGLSRDEPTGTDQVVVLQHLGINRPYLDSRWLSQVRSDLVYRPKGKSDIVD